MGDADLQETEVHNVSEATIFVDPVGFDLNSQVRDCPAGLGTL